MKPQRVVFVTRRFWPLVGGAHTSLLRLAVALRERGAECQFLTVRWQRDWPERIAHHGLPVLRLPRPTTGFWGTLRHIRRIESWLAAHAGAGTIFCASGLRHEACAAVRAARKLAAPVLLRPEGAGLSGDCFWQLDARCGRPIKRICMSADAFIAPTRAAEQELIAAGYPRGRIRYLPGGVNEIETPTPAARLAARRSLAGAQSALTVSEDAFVVLYAGRLDESKGLSHLVEAWQPLAARWPAARLWIVGEGPQEPALRKLIRDLGLSAPIVLPGAFDNLEDFWAAADAYVAPALESGTSTGLLEAMAAGLPIVATDISGHREFIDHHQQGLLVPWQSSKALASALERLAATQDLRLRLGEAARQRVREEYNLERMVEAFQEIAASAQSRVADKT